MDLQDLQDNRRSDLQFGEITEKIIGCAFEVINENHPVHLVHPCSFILFENLCIGA